VRAGEVKVFAEVHPDERCNAVAACTFVSAGNTLRVPATAETPFGGVDDKPQLRECFVTCKLPKRGLALREVSVEGADGEAIVTWPLEVASPAAAARTAHRLCQALAGACLKLTRMHGSPAAPACMGTAPARPLLLLAQELGRMQACMHAWQKV
jgi:hypothetical protein